MENLKKMWKDKNKKIENLVVFLCILVITLLVINRIIKGDAKKEETKDNSNAELVSSNSVEYLPNQLEARLEKILSKMDGVGEVSVLITYSQSSTIVPIFNESTSKSVTEETDTAGGTRTIEAEDTEKNVVTGSDSNPVTGKTMNPTMEGAIVMAGGASNSNVKANIVSAVEAVTGLPTHKIQVFEMGRLP